MQPPIFAKYSSARAFIPEKHDTGISHFKLLKIMKNKKKQPHVSIILEQYFLSLVKIY